MPLTPLDQPKSHFSLRLHDCPPPPPHLVVRQLCLPPEMNLKLPFTPNTTKLSGYTIPLTTPARKNTEKNTKAPETAALSFPCHVYIICKVLKTTQEEPLKSPTISSQSFLQAPLLRTRWNLQPKFQNRICMAIPRFSS